MGLDGLFMVPAKSQRIDGEVAGDRQHPGPHLPPPRVIGGGASPDPQECLLRHLLGDRVGSHDGSRQPIDPWLVAAHERGRGGAVTHRHPRQQGVVRQVHTY
jgi:hypothetical protein